MLQDSPAADSGVVKAGDTLTRIDNVVLKATHSEAVAVLLTGHPGSEVELELMSANWIPKVVSLRRVALCLNMESWIRAVLSLRIRRLELEEPSKALSENSCMERDDLVAGKACYLRICGKPAAAGFHTFDSIPRSGKSISRFSLSQGEEYSGKRRVFTLSLVGLSKNQGEAPCQSQNAEGQTNLPPVN